MTLLGIGNFAALLGAVVCFSVAFGAHYHEVYETVCSDVQGQDGECSSVTAASLLQKASRRSPPPEDSQDNKATLPDLVFYINMAESTDRRQHMEDALAGYPGQVQRVGAITPAEIPNYMSYYKGKLADHFMWKVVANQSSDLDVIVSIYLSHVLLWERLQHQLASSQTALILEDDVEFPDGWKERLRDVVSTAPKDWTVLKVCGHGYARASDMVDAHWAVPRRPGTMLPEEFTGTVLFDDSELDPTGRAGFYRGTCGYLVRGSTISSLLSKVRTTPVEDIDVVLLEPERDVAESATHTHTEKASPACKVYELLPGERVFTTGKHFESTYEREFETLAMPKAQSS